MNRNTDKHALQEQKNKQKYANDDNKWKLEKINRSKYENLLKTITETKGKTVEREEREEEVTRKN